MYFDAVNTFDSGQFNFETFRQPRFLQVRIPPEAKLASKVSVAVTASAAADAVTLSAIDLFAIDSGQAAVSYLGRTTESMTWITPLSAMMSTAVTLAPSTLTPPVVLTVSDEPWTVFTMPALTSFASTAPETT